MVTQRRRSIHTHAGCKEIPDICCVLVWLCMDLHHYLSCCTLGHNLYAGAYHTCVRPKVFFYAAPAFTLLDRRYWIHVHEMISKMRESVRRVVFDPAKILSWCLVFLRVYLIINYYLLSQRSEVIALSVNASTIIELRGGKVRFIIFLIQKCTPKWLV